MRDVVNDYQGKWLLDLARSVIAERLGLEYPVTSEEFDDPVLQQHLGTFVTLTHENALRGCIGNLQPDGTIIESIRRNGVSAAFHDYRFKPLTTTEFYKVHIHISILNKAEPLDYTSKNDLMNKLRPGIDGVILSLGKSKATFLPQVWKQLPEPTSFLDHLCLKAGLNKEIWFDQLPTIHTYQVQSVEEKKE